MRLQVFCVGSGCKNCLVAMLSTLDLYLRNKFGLFKFYHSIICIFTKIFHCDIFLLIENAVK